MSSYTSKVRPILQLAGDMLIRMRNDGLRTEISADGTPVTNADKACGDFLTAALLGAYPGCGIVSEEQIDTSGVGAALTWVIDPIDGTKHYVKGLDKFCIMVALFDTQPIFSMIYYPLKGEWWWAERGKGTFVEFDGVQKRVFVAVAPSPPRILRSPRVELPIGMVGSFGTQKHFAQIIRGELDAFVQSSVGYWDLVPPMLLVQEAGGVVVDYAGNAIVLDNALAQQEGVLAGNSAVVSSIVRSLQR